MFSLVGASLLSSCGTPGIPLPPSLELPNPVRDLRATRKGDKVYLIWTTPSLTTDRQTIRHSGTTRICRDVTAPGLAGKDVCGTEVGAITSAQITASTSPRKPNSGLSSSAGRYVDELPTVGTDTRREVIYAVEVLNDRGRSAGLSNRVEVPAAPAILPPSDFAAQVTADGVVLSWAPVPQPSSTSELRYLYRIYRREVNGKTDAVAGEVPADTAPIARFVDHNFEWEQGYSYHATVVTLIHQSQGIDVQIEGDDTPEAAVFTHDIFPPAPPSRLQAVFSAENQRLFVDLIWHANTENDLAGYNIFRRDGAGQPMKINSELVKMPAFRDLNVSARTKYYYSVSAVDIRGNESAASEEANESVP